MSTKTDWITDKPINGVPFHRFFSPIKTRITLNNAVRVSCYSL